VAARRVKVPGADDIFRATIAAPAPSEPATDPATAPEPTPAAAKAPAAKPAGRPKSARGTSGRVRHDEKMTVYVTSDELLELEHARLTLRSKHGVALDRGRLVREAIAIALADLEAHGEQSILVRRLAQSTDGE